MRLIMQKKAKCFDKIIVSTDNEQIAKISKKYGAEVPFVRPKKLSNNFTALAPVISHAISELKEKNIIPDLVCVLLATTPLLNYRHLVNSKEISKIKFKIFDFSKTNLDIQSKEH